MAEIVALLDDVFADLPLAKVRNSYSPWGEYHCCTDQGRAGDWQEATTHYSWKASGGLWRVAEIDGRRVVEMVALVEHSYPLLLRETPLLPDGEWRLAATFRPLSDAAPVGLVIGYRHSRDFLAVLVEGPSLRLVRRRHDTVTELASAAIEPDDNWLELEVHATPGRVTVRLSGRELCAADPGRSVAGRVGFIANAPVRYAGLRLEAAAPAPRRTPRRHAVEPRLWRKIDTRGCGTDRNLRVGDLDGDGEPEIVLAQHHEYLGSNDYSAILCLTALKLTGEVLWQRGRPVPEPVPGSSDLCFQVHDLDGDGRCEVVHCADFELRVADGLTGALRHAQPTPLSEPPRAPGAWPLRRILGDAIYFADLAGTGRADHLLLKDRYRQLWAYGPDLRERWSVVCRTGHYPAGWDLDGDGREEVLVGYSLVGPDGEVRWQLDTFDHMDAAVVGPLRRGEPPQVVLTGSDAGFFLLDSQGATLAHHPIGHAQSICVAKLREDVPGLQLVADTYWGAPGITIITDDRGRILEEFEPVHYACLLQPVNWTRSDCELILLSTHPAEGGLLDGHGERVVRFPDDGHPVLCSDVKDLDGDGIDEILTWDEHAIWIYKAVGLGDGDPDRYPTRNPWYNDSNYRGQYSWPAGWLTP